MKIKMGTLAAIVAIVMIPAVRGRSSAARIPAQVNGSGNSSRASSSSGGGTKIVAITDPILNMTAYSLTIPSDWIFDGAVIQGSSCASIPFAVFRTSSPDGLTGVKSLPRLDWAWSENPTYTPNGADCLPYKRELAAAEVLKYMIGVLQVEFVRDEPTPELADFRRSISQYNSPTSSANADMARATVRYHINTIAIEERIDVTTVCGTTVFPLLGRQHSCSAYVVRSRAPQQGKWPAEIFNSIGKSLVADQQWNAKWTAVMKQNTQAMGQAVLRAGEDAARLRAAQNSAFQQAQQMRYQQHQDFLASMQRGTDMSMRRAAESADANHRMADDWCDYSLDQQKRLDPNTGMITKDSSAYNYTWINQQGERIQTNDINANPNGNNTGNWTVQENVR